MFSCLHVKTTVVPKIARIECVHSFFAWISIRFAHIMNLHSFCAWIYICFAHESTFVLRMNLHSFCAWIYIRFANESPFVLRMNLHSFCAWISIRFAYIMNLHSFAHESTFVLRMNFHSFCPWSVLFVLRDALEDFAYEISWRLWSSARFCVNRTEHDGGKQGEWP